MKTKLFSGILFAGVIALGATVSLPADAADKIRLMKVVPHPFAFLMADVGKEQGIFSKHGIDLEILGTRGGDSIERDVASRRASLQPLEILGPASRPADGSWPT